RTSEVGRPLMDASEIRQMVKYKEAIAVISNAPPVRLTYPKYARLEHPPLSLREIEFQRMKQGIGEASESDTVNDSQVRMTQENSAALTILKPTTNQWLQVSMSMNQRDVLARQEIEPKENHSFEPEYDPSTIDENRSPMLDDRHLDVWERSI